MSATLVATAAAAGAKVAGVAITQGIQLLADLPKGDSLVGYAQLGNVEPMALVDEDLRTNDMLPDTLQLAQSVFAAYYLRAFSMHNISIGNASVGQRLDKFSTRRSPTSALASTIASVAMEDFEDRLVVDGEVRELPAELKELEAEVLKDVEAVEKAAQGIGLEAADPRVAPSGTLTLAGGYTIQGQQPQGKNTPQSKVGSVSQDTGSAVAVGSGVGKIGTIDISEPVNLGVGRIINVTIKDNGQEVTVPIQIRVNAMYIASQPLVAIMAAGSEDISFGARFKKWRLGGIDFWRDLVFCQDLIDTHKNNLRADKTGVYLQMMQKRRNNGLAAAISGSMSANNASNIIIMSKATSEALEMKIYGKLKDFNTRQKLFQQGYGMLMFIVDPMHGRVRMYTRDIPEYTELSDRDLKGSNKNGGVDIGDVLTAFRAGSTPRL